MVIKILKILLLSTFWISGGCFAKELAGVLGYQNATKDELWQQKQIGFGVKNLLEQALLDKTDFSLIDDKVLLGISKDTIEAQLQAQWMLNDAQTHINAIEKLVEKYQLEHVFWVKITDFSSKTLKLSLAFFSSNEYQDALTLEVCHYTAMTHQIKCQPGEAEQSRTLTSVLYQPADKVSFSESGVGRLSQEAINQSLTKLLSNE